MIVSNCGLVVPLTNGKYPMIANDDGVVATLALHGINGITCHPPIKTVPNQDIAAAPTKTTSPTRPRQRPG